jgi:hypothetical protein
LGGKPLKTDIASAVSQNSCNLNLRYFLMNMSVSPDIMAATISAPQSVSRPAPCPGGPPDHASENETMGGALPSDVKQSLLTGAGELEASGASSEDIKSYVEGEMEANGVDGAGGSQRSGQLVDMMT